MEQEIRTASGVSVYKYKNEASHGFFLSLFVRAGSMYESEENNGITHFLEHISIRNINKLMDGELYRELDRHGLEFNASTFSEMVQFYITGAPENFSFAADILCRLFSPVVLSAADIDAERRRIKAEIREADDKSSLLSFSNGIVHSGTSLARPITGTLGGVSKISARRLEEYRRSIFVRDNFFFYLTGSFTDENEKALISLIDSQSFPEGRANANVAPVCKSFGKRPQKVEVKNADFTMVRFCFDIDMKKVAVPVSDLIYDMLLSGYNSRLFIEMSENRGLFYDVSGAVERYRNIGQLYFTFELRERDLYGAIELVIELLSDFKKTLFGEQDCMKAGYVDNANMLLDDARELNFTMAYDNHIMNLSYPTISERIAAYKNVTPEDIRRGACEIFTPENLTLTLKGKKKKIDTKRIEEIIKKL